MSEIGGDVSRDRRRLTVPMVIDALASLSLPPADLPGIRTRLMAGDDFELVDDLGLDSLGAMEFCIQLELEAGLVVTPEDLLITGSVQSLLLLLEARLETDGADGQGAC